MALLDSIIQESARLNSAETSMYVLDFCGRFAVDRESRSYFATEGN